MGTPVRRGFASRRFRIVIASVFALGGIAWGAWTLYETTKPREYNRSFRPRSPGGGAGGAARGEGRAEVPRRGGAPGDGDAVRRLLGGGFEPEPESYAWSDVRADADIPLVMDEMVRSLRTTMDESPELASLGMARRDQAADAARLAIEPLVRNDPEMYEAAVRELAGDADALGETDGEALAMFEQLAELLEHASLDLTNLRVSVPDPDAGRWTFEAGSEDGAGPSGTVDRIAIRTRASDDDGEGSTMRVMTQSVSTASVFPDVADWRSRGVRSVRFSMPGKRRDSKDDTAGFRFGATMVWNEQAGAWQPAEYAVTRFNLEGAKIRFGGARGGGR